jgi:hypothetical protein
MSPVYSSPFKGFSFFNSMLSIHFIIFLFKSLTIYHYFVGLRASAEVMAFLLLFLVKVIVIFFIIFRGSIYFLSKKH